MIKQSWKEHLQGHFWQLEEYFNRSLEPGENKVILCPDPRCALSFDSIQDLQCHCQDVYCVERIKLNPAKRRRQTYQSSLNVKAFPGMNVKLEHQYDLLIEKSPYKYIDEIMDSQMLKSVDVIIPTGRVELEEMNSPSRSYSLSTTHLAANHENRSSSAVSFISSENSVSIIDWTSDKVALENPTPVSSVYSNLPLSIDPRLLNESDPQPITLSS